MGRDGPPGCPLWLAKHTRNQKNREILERIANDELGHYEVLKQLTKREVKPQRLRVLRYRLIARVLGLSFGLRLMERGEGIAYIITVLILIAPYLFFSNVYLALAVMMTLNVGIILSYNFYITTAKGLPLWRRFGQMVTISFGVACLSFLLGLVARAMFGVEL